MMSATRSLTERLEAESCYIRSVESDGVELRPVFEANLYADRVASDAGG